MNAPSDRTPPAMPADLVRDLRQQTVEVSELFADLDRAVLGRRPPSGKWSVVEHVDHLVKVNRKYADQLVGALRKGRDRGRTGSGPFRGSMVGRAFANSMEPPVSMRVKTMKAMRPDSSLDPSSTLQSFEAVQDRLLGLLRDSEGLDLDRIRTSSPFMRLLRAPVFSWFCVLSAHTRRHIWLIRETLAQLDDTSA